MNNILLVDPNPITALDIFIRLEDAGYKVFGPIATTGEGLKLLKDQTISAVILDAHACRQRFPELHETLMASDIPIIFLTENESGEIGNKVVIRKTENSAEVLQAVQSLEYYDEAA